MALSRTGTLVYRRGNRAIDALTWVGRRGTIQGEVAPELNGNLSSVRRNHEALRLTGWTGAPI